MENKKHLPIFLKDYKPSPFLIDEVQLEFELNTITQVKTILNMRSNSVCEKTTTDLTLVGEELELKSIKLNGKLLDLLLYRVTAESLVIFNVPDSFTLEIITHIKPAANTQLSGLYKSNGNFCTQCEAEGFRRITYFLDRPDIMARYTTTLIADEKLYPVLLSNGNCIATGKVEGGKHWVRFQDPFKKPCYLFALVAGDLGWIEDKFKTQSGRDVILRIFAEKGQQDKCFHAMHAVKKAMRWDEEAFGREYDLDIYMLVAVSDFNMGAMENKGLNIFNSKYILAKPETATDEDYLHIESVIAHEYFHNWSGNRITCRDWFQLSLKEGLTIFRDQSYTADTTSATVARIHDVNELRLSQFPEDAGPLSHPVRPESYIEINNFYTATIYNKGAEVIRMMQTILGKKLFRKGMDLYFETYDGQAVTIEEFVKSMELASGMDLTQFRLWYSTPGTPHLKVNDDYDEKTKTYSLTIAQNKNPPLMIPIQVGLLDHQGKEIAAELLILKEQQQTFIFKEIKSKPVPSLLRHFSAPVKMDYPYTDEDFLLLFKWDTDLFNRWEAGQKYAVKILLKLIHHVQNQIALYSPTEFISALREALTQLQKDKLYLAELLVLPSEKYLAEQMSVVDPNAIHVAREFLLNDIAKALKDDFKKTYLQNHLEEPYHFDLNKMAERRLKNICLSYLTRLPDNDSLAVNQFDSSLTHNMTDTMGAFRPLSNLDRPVREKVINAFYDYWQKEALVVDKWLAIQAESKLPSTLERVKTLVKHPAFDIKNPNKVYSLIGSFGYRNPVNFHVASGAGYQFLAEIVMQLDLLNPSVATRMVKPLTDWRRYDDNRQQLMRAQLERILSTKKLSRDVYEIVSKSLNSAEK